jgi:hypothetical protein
VEIERKYDADEGTPLPDWSSLPDVASTGEPELRELDARYYDTAEYALASAGYALRRRSGGPDAGWHIKGPRVGGGRPGSTGRSATTRRSRMPSERRSPT